MTVSVTSPVTGAAQTGLTAPTYTVVADIAPDNNGKQWAVTALGGTQTGVTVHSVSSPFTLLFARPKTFRSLGKPNPTTGLVKDVPMNIYRAVARKGVTPLAGQPFALCLGRMEFQIPAGSDSADAPNVRAMQSLLIGAVNQQSAGFGDTTVSGIM